MEKVIQSINILATDGVHTFSVGQVIGCEEIADIIKYKQATMMFNKNDEIIAQFNLPAVGILYKEEVQD